MSVNNVQKTQQPKVGIIDSFAQQGKKAIIGLGAGLLTGRAVSLAIPVSRNKITYKVVDHYIKADKNGVGTSIKNLEENLKQQNITKEQVENILKNIENLLKPLKDDASKVVDNYFKTAKKNRPKDDIVALAKKAAKKSQSAKIMGTAALAGMFIMMFSDLFSGILPNKKALNEQTAQKSVTKSKVMTHQG